MRIGVLGVNSKLANPQLREKLAKTCQMLFAAHNALHGPHCIVLLSTCNRTELYFSSNDLAATHIYILNLLRQEIQNEPEFDQKLYSYFGSDCFLHLCRVTTGLDSAILGETEIQGQVKTSYEQATEYISLPPWATICHPILGFFIFLAGIAVFTFLSLTFMIDYPL